MSESDGIMAGNWLWGSVWVFYALFYGFYFSHVASRLKPVLKYVSVPGSPERLARKRVWCFRFALFMTIPTALEMIRSTDFTSSLIRLAPCVFGIWVMRSIWVEVLNSKMPRLVSEKLKRTVEQKGGDSSHKVSAKKTS